jgi:Ca2+:H+ antiporter
LLFDRGLFTGTATLAVISLTPIALLSFPAGDTLSRNDRDQISLAAGVGLLLVGAFFIWAELRKESEHDEAAAEGVTPVEPRHASALSGRDACVFLGVGALIAALTSDWFVAGFEPAVERIGVPTAFAALIIIPFLGNVAENYVALRYAWEGDGDAAMAVIMHSVVQIALLVTGILLVVSRFVGSQPLTLRYDPEIAIALTVSLIILWMILHDGEITPVEAVGLLVTFVILSATVWVGGSI